MEELGYAFLRRMCPCHVHAAPTVVHVYVKKFARLCSFSCIELSKFTRKCDFHIFVCVILQGGN